jgi:DNA-binding response OmpR family regulator
VRRKILVIEDESSIRKVIHILLDTLKCDGDVTCNGRQDLDTLRCENFDAVLLDLRAPESPPDQVVQQICEIRPKLMGRVLLITGEISDRRTLELIEQSGVTCIRKSNLAHELWDRLRVLLTPGQSPQSTH